MNRLTRDGTAEPVSRDQILRHARGQGNVHFPCSADHEQDWQPYPVDPYSAMCDDHTYMHTYIHTYIPYTVYNIKTRGKKKTETGQVHDRTPLFKSTDHSIFMQLLLPPQNLRRRHQLSARCTTPLRLRCNVLRCIVLNRNVLYCIVLPGTLYCTVPFCSKNEKSKHMLPSQGYDWRFQKLCLSSPFSPDRYPSCSRELPAPPTARSRSPSRGPGHKVRCWTASGRCRPRSIIALSASSSQSHRRMT